MTRVLLGIEKVMLTAIAYWQYCIMLMFALLSSTGQSSFLSSSFSIVYSSTVIPNRRGNDAGIDKEGNLNQWRKVACRKRRKDLSRDRTCQVSIMRILNKDITGGTRQCFGNNQKNFG
jgi:hypothetical protein